jgi:uncharacterized membrane protein YfcA
MAYLQHSMVRHRRTAKGRSRAGWLRDERCCRAARRSGGELLIPTLILLFGVDIKLSGGLSLAVSSPRTLVGFTRYSRDRSFVVLRKNRRFVLVMAAGSIVGSFVGGRLLGMVPSPTLLPLLALILMISAVKIWRHG